MPLLEQAQLVPQALLLRARRCRDLAVEQVDLLLVAQVHRLAGGGEGWGATAGARARERERAGISNEIASCIKADALIEGGEKVAALERPSVATIRAYEDYRCSGRLTTTKLPQVVALEIEEVLADVGVGAARRPWAGYVSWGMISAPHRRHA